MKPCIFISAVSSELKATRQLVANVLLRLGYDPIWQDIFGTESGDLRQVLREKIDQCEGLIQIVGHAYGAEPPTIDPEMGRVSYTQFEFLHAQQRAKQTKGRFKTWLIFAEDGCTRDTPLEQLDLPCDTDHPDPTGYQSECRDLQDAWRQRVLSNGHIRYTSSDDKDLELNVSRISFPIRRGFLTNLRLGQYGCIMSFTLLSLFFTLMFWQAVKVRETDIETIHGENPKLAKKIAEELSALNPEALRAALRRTIEETYQKQWQEADNLPAFDKREAAKKTAEEMREQRLERVDKFLTSITSTIESGQASTEFLELTRIIQEEGVDRALAYIGRTESRLLQEAEQLTEQLTQERRRKLSPLLEGVRLQQAKNELDQALTLCDKLLKQDDEWLELLHEHCWVQIEIGRNAANYETVLSALTHYEAAKQSARRLIALDASNPTWQRDLMACYENLGDVFLTLGRTDDALKQYEDGLKINRALAEADPSGVQMQRDLSVMYNKMGDVFLKLGRTDDALTQYEDSMKIRRTLANADSSDPQMQRDLSVSYNKLGNVFLAMGLKDDALTQFKEDLKIARSLAVADPSNIQTQRDLSVSFNKLGDILLTLGQTGDALAQYEDSLKISRSLAAADPSNVQMQRDLSVTYNKLGDVFLTMGRTDDALAQYEKDLKIARTLATVDPSNAQKQRDLMVSHYKLGQVRVQLAEYEAAIDRFQQGMAVLDAMIARKLRVESAAKEKAILEQQIEFCQAALLATGDWETLLKTDVDHLPSLLTTRATLLAQRGRTDDVAQAGAKLRELAATADSTPNPGKPAGTIHEMLYNAACAYGLCAMLVVKDKPEPSASELSEQKKFIALALACLKEAITAGFDSFDHMQQDSDLTPLHDLPEFKQLLPTPAAAM